MLLICAGIVIPLWSNTALLIINKLIFYLMVNGHVKCAIQPQSFVFQWNKSSLTNAEHKQLSCNKEKSHWFQLSLPLSDKLDKNERCYTDNIEFQLTKFIFTNCRCTIELFLFLSCTTFQRIAIPCVQSNSTILGNKLCWIQRGLLSSNSVHDYNFNPYFY